MLVIAPINGSAIDGAEENDAPHEVLFLMLSLIYAPNSKGGEE